MSLLGAGRRTVGFPPKIQCPPSRSANGRFTFSPSALLPACSCSLLLIAAQDCLTGVDSAVFALQKKALNPLKRLARAQNRADTEPCPHAVVQTRIAAATTISVMPSASRRLG